MIKCNQCEKISNCPYGIQDCESIISTCDEFSFNLIKHDSELLDKVAEKLKAKYPIYFNEFGMVINNTLQEDIDEVIVDMKAEVLNGK